MERRMMAAIFLGASVILLVAYALVNRGGSIPTTDEKNNEGLFSANGSATMGQPTGMDNEWGSAMVENGGIESPEDANNATKNIAKVAFYQMKSLDQQGKSPFDKANINTPEMQATIERSLESSMDSLFGDMLISDRDIKISANNTKDSKKRYLKAFEAALARHPAQPEFGRVEGGLRGLISRACNDGDAGVSKDVSANYAAIAKDVTAATVPSAWADFHKQAVEHYRKGDIIFGAIANCNADIIKGVVAVQKIPKFGMDALTLQNLLKKMYTEVGL